jgi:carbamoyl-phosphate synthase large subunit
MTMSTEINYENFALLISSASKKISLINAVHSAIKRMGLRIKVIAGDSSESALAQYVADDFWVMPETHDNALKQILEGCLKRNVRIIIPTRDGELLFWANHAKQFENYGIHVIISSADAVAKCIDKIAFSQFGFDNELPIIKSELCIEKLASTQYVVKERFGSGSIDVGVGLNYVKAQEYASALKNPIYQCFIEGMEFSADAWIDKFNNVKAVILRRRDVVMNGESCVTTTFTDKRIEDQVKKCLEELKLVGPVVLQGIIDSKNRLHIIECNTRFGGASTAGIAAGADSICWSIYEATGRSANDLPFKRISGELRQIRVTTDIYSYGSDF